MALSIAIWHFDLQITIRTNFFVSCGAHFVKQQFSEVTEMCTLLL